MSTDDSDDTCARESHEDGALLGCFLRGLACGLQALGFGAPHVHDDLVEAGSMAAAKAAGKVRMEGKDYVMHDGDVVEFRFNV